MSPVPTTEVATPGGAVAPSIVRTIVPLIVGLLLSLGITEVGGFEVSTILSAVLTAALTAVYYVVVRFLEVYASPKWGYILGLSQKSPIYAKAEAPANVLLRDEHGAISLERADFERLAVLLFGVALAAIGLSLVLGG